MKRWLVLLALLAWPAAAPAQEPTPERLAAARELLVVMDAEAVFFRTIALTIERAELPDLSGPDATRLHEVLVDLVRWEALEPGMAALYARLYTVAELRAMAAFYRTPL